MINFIMNVSQGFMIKNKPPVLCYAQCENQGYFMTFDEFKTIITQGLESDKIKIEVELTELDLAIIYAIGREQDEKGTVELFLTAEDIDGLILKYCGKEVYDRVFSEE